ncbi:putative serine protease PepD [Ruaniaceae bacterium KH17]|nr:putative serine protease PepD [Ruaniaceae bacterium KH17]
MIGYVTSPWQPPSQYQPGSPITRESPWDIPPAAGVEPPAPPVPPVAPAATSQYGRNDTVPLTPGVTNPTQPIAVGPNVPPAIPPAAPKRPRRQGMGKPVVALIALLALLSGFLLGSAFGPSIFAPGVTSSVAPDGGTGPATPPTVVEASPISDVAEAVLPSTVFIQARSGSSSATGTGMVLRADGYIVTNNHVIAGAVDNGTVIVAFSDGQSLEADVVGRTQDYDLAVLKVERDDLVPLPLADSDYVKVGETVVAVGAPLGLNGTVTSGIVSALNRAVTAGNGEDLSFINAIQTDAAINPGNSGGPLVNLAGEVIGINSAIAQPPGATSATGSIGLGFAIPSNQVARTSQQIIETGHATYPVIGVYLDRTHTGRGALVAADQPTQPAVNPGGPADQAGIRSGDLILAIDGTPVIGADEAIVTIRSNAPGDTVTLTIERGGAQRDVQLTLGESEAN